MNEIQQITIDTIVIESRRKININKVQELAQSIKAVGLLNPITVDTTGKLIAGLHRIEAYKSLGKKEIPHITVDGLDALGLRLAQLDENLVRNEGTVLERAEWLKERKEIYEQLYPETRQYVAGGKGKEKAKNTTADSAVVSKQSVGFVKDAASKISKSERTIRQDIQIATNLTETTKQLIEDTSIEDKKTDLLALARLDEEEQEEIAAIIANGKAKSVKDAKKKRKRAKHIESAQDVALATETYRLICGDFAEVGLQLADESVDVIITDPPYSKEYLHLYNLLAREAARLLKSGGSLLTMAGQSYLPEVLRMLEQHLTYHWTIAYETPGGQAAMIRPRNVNTFWKPVFWFVKGKYEGDWRGDVVVSNVNENDKRFHDWGQSESGIGKLVADYTLPGDLVLDPFVGGGTTAVVCIRLGRQFVGIDIEQEQIDITLGRLKEESGK